MSDTIKSVCDKFMNSLCEVPIQDFQGAAAIREMQRAFDPHGTKKLSKSEVEIAESFFQTLLESAHS